MSGKIFKEMCQELHKEHKEAGGTKSYDEIVNMVLQTPWGAMMEGAPLEEVGEVFGISRERVRQIENSGIRKLRNPDSKITRNLNAYTKIELANVCEDQYRVGEG